MPDFKIAAAQVPSIRGDIDRNIAVHAAAIEAAAKHQVSVLAFPELSLIGYEPELAAELAITPADGRLTPLHALAMKHRMTVLVGAPLRVDGPRFHIGAILFEPNGATRTYAKMHLGAGERALFLAGSAPLALPVGDQMIGVAICADASRASHPQTYADMGATIYAAGVFLNAEWYATDAPRLAGYSARFRLLVVMANQADSVGTYTSVGKSAVWSPDGALLAEAKGTQRCLVIATHHHGKWSGEVVPF